MNIYSYNIQCYIKIPEHCSAFDYAVLCASPFIFLVVALYHFLTCPCWVMIRFFHLRYPKCYKLNVFSTCMDIFTALKLIFISLIPWIELRGSIPIGIGMGLPPLHVFLICTISDILLIPVLILALKIAVPFVLKIDTLNRFYQWNVVGTLNRYEKYKKWEEIGLILFVAIPLPFTGVYSGTFVSYLLQFKKREAFLSIATGAVIAGIIVTSLSVNFLG